MTRLLPVCATTVLLLATASGGCDRPSTPSSSTPPLAAETATATSGEGSGTTDEARTPSVDVSRIVTLSGGVTETVAALGFADAIVGVDASSEFPESVRNAARLGYHRALSSEGVLSLRPTLIIGTVADGPPPVVAQLEATGIRYERTAEIATVEDAYDRIRAVGVLLGKEPEAHAIVTSIEQKLRNVAARLPPADTRPGTLLVYARGHGTLLVAGRDTIGETLVVRAGGRHIADSFEGFRPLTPEGLVAMQPDVIIVPGGGLETIGGIEGILAIPGVAETPAGRHRAFVSLPESLLLSFGPRLGEGIEALAEALRTHTPIANQ